MKTIRALFVWIILLTCLGSQALAQQGSRGAYGNDPLQVLDTIVGESNASQDTRIQETALDKVSNTQGSFGSQYRIANTLDSIRVNITPYLQWMVFIGLSVAVVLIIYNGFNLVTGQGDMKVTKTKILNIVYWILILTGFYFIIQIALSVLSYFA